MSIFCLLWPLLGLLLGWLLRGLWNKSEKTTVTVDTEQVNRLTTEKNQLETKWKESNQLATSHKSKYDELNKKFSALSADFDRYKTTSETKSKEYEARIKEWETKPVDHTELNNLKVELESERTKVVSLTEEIAVKEKEYNALVAAPPKVNTTELDALKAKLDESNSINEQLIQKLENSQKEVARLESKPIDNGELDTLKAELAGEKEKFSLLEKTSKEWKAQLETKASSQTELEQLKNKIHSLETENSELAQKVSDTSTLDALRTELSTEKEKVTAFKAQLASAQEQASDDSELNALKAKLDESNAINEQLIAKLESAQKQENSEADALQKTINQLEAKNKELIDTKSTLETKLTDTSEVDQLRADLIAANTKIAQHEDQEDVQKELASANAKVETLEKEVEMLKKQARNNVVMSPQMLDNEKPVQKDDLTKVEGIGPKTAELLHKAGINNFKQLADTKTESIQTILDDAGARFALLNPGTWNRQAALARDGKWDELNTWQDELDGGIEVDQQKVSVQKDDLTKVEGIGPKTAELLHKAGINNFKQLADTKTEAIQTILDDAGARFALLNPGTWNRQAALARDGEWDKLNTWQDELDGGIEVSSQKDDLTKVEGIGPKINELLNDGGIYSFAQLANAKVDRLKEILNDAGPRFQMHNPTTWPQQSKLARDGKWDELQELQDKLDGGV